MSNKLIQPLVDIIKSQLIAIEATKEDKEACLNWMVGEYKNYMVITSDAYKETIDNYIVEFPDSILNKFLSVILEHLGKYGATKAIFLASRELLLINKDNKQ
jgi:hypothetical protein